MNHNRIFIENKRKSLSNILIKHGNAVLIDLTSKSNSEWVKFSPFYPHGKIPVPFSEGCFSESVEGVWQGLKVFENEGIDISRFRIKNMKNIKRTIQKHGRILGHQMGIFSNEILNYNEAKEKIYLPTYKWILENRLQNELNELIILLEHKNLIFLDYEINTELFNAKPLSHAFLVKLFIEGHYPPVLPHLQCGSIEYKHF
jgi:hypothetical protein